MNDHRDQSVPRADLALALQRAVRLSGQNEFGPAAAVCEHVLSAAPDHFDALRLLGNLQLQLNQPEAAVRSYDRALAQQPDSSELWYNRGNAMHRLQRFGEAVADYERALLARADFPECLNNRGTALQALKRFEEALASHDAALELRPDYPGALNNKGLALLRCRRPEEALQAFSRALELRPEYLAARSNLSTALYDLRRLREALAAADQVLRVKGDLPEALIIRASIRMESGEYRAAVPDLERALEIQPDSPACLALLAGARSRLELPRQAIRTLERLNELRPDFGYVEGDLLSARASCCDWAGIAAQWERMQGPMGAGERVIRPFQLLSVSDDAATQLRCAKVFSADTFPSARAPLWRGERYGNRKIRIAYVSPDFRDHPVSYLMAGIFEEHDRERFEVVGISLGPEDGGDTGRRVKRSFDEFVEAREKSDFEVATMIRERSIDIAIDLKGFTDVPRAYPAFRPAPALVNYLGFPGSLGSSFHDYIIADEFVIPRDRRSAYSEKVVYLPECFQANDARRRTEHATERREHGLPESSLVLASFNNCHKITPEMFDTWMRVLKAVPDSVLWIFAESTAARENLTREASIRGIDAERLIFASRQPYSLHLARLGLADLFLDTFPFNGGTTASDALWARVPVITCSGSAFAARMAGSLLRAIGLPDLVTCTLQDYETLAISVASDRAKLAERRNRLACNSRHSSLFDSARLCGHLEAAYVAMWQRVQRGEQPEHVEVAPVDARSTVIP
jgi:protein O-GlcNAc transferase